MKTNHMILAGLLLVCAVSRSSAEDVQILSLSPVAEHSCIAAPIALAEGQSLSGLSWLNNDSSQPFPKLLLMEGLPGVAPDISQTGLILQEVTGEVLEWGEVSLDVPVTSTTDFIYAVWVFPSEAETTGQGLGQGPGIGIEMQADGVPFYLSADGEQWMEYSRDYRLCVQPVVTPAAARLAVFPVSLSALAEGVEYAPESASPGEIPVLPSRTVLHGSRPNPFNPRTTVSYDLAGSARVSLKVFDARGRLVRRLVSEKQVAGVYNVIWRGKDDRGASVSSGVYFMRFEASGYVQSERITLVR
ncbi:hypothetical protein DRQ53_13000 [bacterium]|nr:MAG: hypothetical protein DRQ53_13000 [bacterium]